jgi:hypothetical protein
MNPDTFTWPVILLGAGAVLFIGLLIAWGVKTLDRRDREDLTAEQIQTVIGDAIAREPSLADASILPVGSIPLDGRPLLELTGHVPSADARARAVRVAQRQLARVRPGMQVVDRLEVDPSLGRRRRA